MATKTSSTEIIQQKEVFVKSNEVLKEMERAGQLEPYTKYYTPDDDVNFSSLRTKVLWTNPNPTSQFDNVSINLEENNCDYFEIRYRYNTTYNMSDSVKIPAITGETTLLTIVNTPVILYVRKATVTSKTTIAFDSSYYGTTGSESVANTTIIPIEVIGYTKTPAMIYTGAELHEGNGISIENGVISASQLIKELWINSDPASNIGGINITLASADYDYLIVIHSMGTLFVSKGDSGFMSFVDIGYWNAANDTMLVAQRRLTYINDTTYTIENCNTRYWNNGQKGGNYVGNSYLKPFKILGVKL